MTDKIKEYINKYKNKKSFIEIFDELKLTYCEHDIKFIFLYTYNFDIDQDIIDNALKEKRKYQQKLRDDALKRYNNKCVISDTSREKCLETAHIKPVSECESLTEKSNIDNALLLWMDIHKYFDDYQISINPLTSCVEVNINNETNEWMTVYNNKYISNLTDGTKQYLKWHYSRFVDAKTNL